MISRFHYYNIEIYPTANIFLCYVRMHDEVSVYKH